MSQRRHSDYEHQLAAARLYWHQFREEIANRGRLDEEHRSRLVAVVTRNQEQVARLTREVAGIYQLYIHQPSRWLEDVVLRATPAIKRYIDRTVRNAVRGEAAEKAELDLRDAVTAVIRGEDMRPFQDDEEDA